MTASWLWNNLLLYSVQIAGCIGIAAIVPPLFRLAPPAARLAFWQVALAACLLMPALRPWKQEAATGAVQVVTTVVGTVPAQGRSRRLPSFGEIGLGVIAIGVTGRMCWLAAGLIRLRRYRRHSIPLSPMPAWGVEADLRVSREISSPVTFGFRKPVVLLPAHFAALPEPIQDAILCHEILHVRRRDWLFTVGEELVRAVLWFHPAIWWLLNEIQLAREQTVDSAVIGMTRSRDRYVDALLTIAGVPPRLEVGLAPLFLRGRHLKQRVVSILKEVHMSKTRTVSAFAAGLGMLAASCWLITGAFQLEAAPQNVTDAAGVTVEQNGAGLMHRASVNYPAEAIAKGVQGTVVVQVKLDETGTVSDASVLSGPDELRKPVLQSVLNWHFTKDAAGSTRQISVSFELPKGGQARGSFAMPDTPVPIAVPTSLTRQDTVLQNRRTAAVPVNSISVVGLSDQARDELLSKLPVHEGDTMTAEMAKKLAETVRSFDPHLGYSLQGTSSGEMNIVIRQADAMGRMTAPPPPPLPPGLNASVTQGPPQSIRVGGTVIAANLITKVNPVYPELAKQARIQGTVQFNATISKDGRVENLTLVSGHPLLVEASQEAVKQWVYKPVLLNGNPVTVLTTIDVNFTLMP